MAAIRISWHKEGDKLVCRWKESHDDSRQIPWWMSSRGDLVPVGVSLQRGTLLHRLIPAWLKVLPAKPQGERGPTRLAGRWPNLPANCRKFLQIAEGISKKNPPFQVTIDSVPMRAMNV